MPRYLVERTFPDGLDWPFNGDCRQALLSIVYCNADRKVFWLHSYVATDRSRIFCIYEARNPEALRLAAHSNRLPVTRITEIQLLHPHPYVLG